MTIRRWSNSDLPFRLVERLYSQSPPAHPSSWPSAGNSTNTSSVLGLSQPRLSWRVGWSPSGPQMHLVWWSTWLSFQSLIHPASPLGTGPDTSPLRCQAGCQSSAPHHSNAWGTEKEIISDGLKMVHLFHKKNLKEYESIISVLSVLFLLSCWKTHPLIFVCMPSILAMAVVPHFPAPTMTKSGGRRSVRFVGSWVPDGPKLTLAEIVIIICTR